MSDIDTKAIRADLEQYSENEDYGTITYCHQIKSLCDALDAARGQAANRRADILSLDCDWYETNDSCLEDRPCLRCQLDDARAQHASELEQADADYKAVKAALSAARAELTDRDAREAQHSSKVEHIAYEARKERALACEEAARLMEARLRDVRNEPFRAREIRALAPLDSGLCVVRKEMLKEILSDLRRVDEVLALGEIAESNTHYRVKGAVDALEKEVGE